MERIAPLLLCMYTEGSEMEGKTPGDVRNALLAALEASAPDHGIDIVDVEVVGSTKARTVRVRIDHVDEEADGITLEEVSAQTGWISELLDELDPLEGSYLLEVSSPGLARPLRRIRDFERFAGERVSLKTRATEGRRKYTGLLKGYEDGKVLVSCDEGDFAFGIDEIESCAIKPTFDEGSRKNGKKSSFAGKR